MGTDAGGDTWEAPSDSLYFLNETGNKVHG